MPRKQAPDNPKERRRFTRVQYDGAATLVFDGDRYPCVIDNLSPGGASVYGRVLPVVGERVVLYVQGAGRMHAEVVTAEQDRVGLKFLTNDDKERRLIEKLSAAMVKTGAD